jgi:hypothetical protein
MFSAYKAKVILAYQKKREAGQLSLNILNSAPAKLREECLDVLQKRYLKKDDRTIRAFFKHRDETTDNEHRIRKSKGETFKTLDNYLKGITADTNDKNIELLAWLIDFEPRPYKFGQTIVVDDDIITEIKEEENEEKEKTTEEKISDGQSSKNGAMVVNNTSKEPIQKKIAAGKFRAAMLVLIILAFSCGGSYWLWQKMTAGGCAIWTGDHYRSVTCDQQAGNTAVVVVDKQRLADFKMITKPDTLSTYSVEKVWYFKKNDSLEVYTAKGYHPVHPERELKKLTDYMYRKYIRQNKFYRTSL